MKKQKGFTLIEIMISLMLGLIVIGGALSIYISTVRGNSDTIKSARLNYDLDSTMAFMVNDIKRAGYWGGAFAGSDAINTATAGEGNPFTEGTANIQIPTSSCILYTYDFDGDSNLDGAGGESEFFGFKLDNGAIKVHSTTTIDATGDCSSNSPTTRWQSIVDSNLIEITHLQFSLSPITEQAAVANSHPLLPALTASTKCLNTSPFPDETWNKPCATSITDGDIPSGNNLLVEKRTLNIHLSGRVKNDTEVIKSISTSVQIRNPKLRLHIQP